MKKSELKSIIKEIIKAKVSLNEIYMPSPENIVEYVKPFPGAQPFMMEDSRGPQKFEFCVGKLGNGKLGLAIYAYRGDFAITVDWFNEIYGSLL